MRASPVSFQFGLGGLFRVICFNLFSFRKQERAVFSLSFSHCSFRFLFVCLFFVLFVCLLVCCCYCSWSLFVFEPFFVSVAKNCCVSMF